MSLIQNDKEENYIRCMNLALKFIDNNLDSELSLETISKVAFYSPHHFHRIFKAIIGETPNGYVTRKRIEKAASILMHKKEITITDLSFQYGFKSNASFTKTFKNFYGISPSEFRKQIPSKYPRIQKLKSKNGQEDLIFDTYIRNINNYLLWIKMNAKIEIKEIPKHNLASIMHYGFNGVELAFQRIKKWGATKELFKSSNSKIVRIFHDSPIITTPDKVRMTIGLTTNKSFLAEGEICPAIIKKGKCIVGRFEIVPADFEKAWSSLFLWMTKNKYRTTEENHFEIYHLLRGRSISFF